MLYCWGTLFVIQNRFRCHLTIYKLTNFSLTLRSSSNSFAYRKIREKIEEIREKLSKIVKWHRKRFWITKRCSPTIQRSQNFFFIQFLKKFARNPWKIVEWHRKRFWITKRCSPTIQHSQKKFFYSIPKKFVRKNLRVAIDGSRTRVLQLWSSSEFHCATRLPWNFIHLFLTNNIIRQVDRWQPQPY